MQVHVHNNSPDNWLKVFPRPSVEGHKYHRGYAAIYGAPNLTGATRLAATACSRIGAGLVAVIAGDNAGIYRASLPPDIMVLSSLPANATVALGGPGGIETKALEQLLGNTGLTARIFDADALQPRTDSNQLDQHCVLTPHVGELERIFGQVGPDLEQAAGHAARAFNAILVVKSSRTIVAHPDGRLCFNTNTSPYLAKAGTGDVLAGMVAGLLAQGMPHFEACEAAVWIHGEAGVRLNAGLVASDIPEIIPEILKGLLSGHHR